MSPSHSWMAASKGPDHMLFTLLIAPIIFRLLLSAVLTIGKSISPKLACADISRQHMFAKDVIKSLVYLVNIIALLPPSVVLFRQWFLVGFFNEIPSDGWDMYVKNVLSLYPTFYVYDLITTPSPKPELIIHHLTVISFYPVLISGALVTNVTQANFVERTALLTAQSLGLSFIYFLSFAFVRLGDPTQTKAKWMGRLVLYVVFVEVIYGVVLTMWLVANYARVTVFHRVLSIVALVFLNGANVRYNMVVHRMKSRIQDKLQC